MLKVTDDDGTRLDTPQPADTAVFTNDYSADTGYASITAQKDTTHLSGRKSPYIQHVQFQTDTRHAICANACKCRR